MKELSVYALNSGCYSSSTISSHFTQIEPHSAYRILLLPTNQTHTNPTEYTLTEMAGPAVIIAIAMAAGSGTLARLRRAIP